MWHKHKESGHARDARTPSAPMGPTGPWHVLGLRVGATYGTRNPPKWMHVSVVSLVLENFVLGKTRAYPADEGFVRVWVLATVTLPRARPRNDPRFSIWSERSSLCGAPCAWLL